VGVLTFGAIGLRLSWGPSCIPSAVSPKRHQMLGAEEAEGGVQRFRYASADGERGGGRWSREEGKNHNRQIHSRA
jgi:hypothetical protein